VIPNATARIDGSQILARRLSKTGALRKEAGQRGHGGGGAVLAFATGKEGYEVDMKMEQYIRAIAGAFVVISLALGYVHSPYWHLFTAFVGLNLLQSAFTGRCPMENILESLGVAEKPQR